MVIKKKNTKSPGHVWLHPDLKAIDNGAGLSVSRINLFAEPVDKAFLQKVAIHPTISSTWGEHHSGLYNELEESTFSSKSASAVAVLS